MRRFFIFVLQISGLAALALWLADRPGTAHIVWHDTVIETSAAFLALAVLVLAFGVHLLWRLWHFLRHGPTHWRLRRRIQRLEEGQRLLTQGLVAIASGHASDAGRLAVEARKNAGNSIAVQWLQAQAAQLAGDTLAAREIFRGLAAQPEAAVLGYRGLISEARRAENWREVDQLMAALQTQKPSTPWLSLIRMESAARRMQWIEAESALSHAIAARLMDPASGRRLRAALRIAASRTASSDAEALQAAEQATRQMPDWLPAILNLAERLGQAKHRRAALRLVERSWKRQPHPHLAWIAAQQGKDFLEAFQLTEQMCRANESAVESRIALAEAALNASLWGAARRHLLAALGEGAATRQVYRLLAKLERQEHGDERAATSWLLKAGEAAPDAVWLCQTCGTVEKEWQPLCRQCHSFASIDWQKPDAKRAAAPLPAMMTLIGD